MSPNGSTANYNDCYHPRWGRHKNRTKPSPGNHEYESDRHDGAAYYAYFGDLAGPVGAGYYGYDLGAWRLISLNSNIPSGPTADQYRWLREDLQQHQSRCQLVYWHHPRFSSGQNGGFPELDIMRDVWQLLYDFNVDVDAVRAAVTRQRTATGLGQHHASAGQAHRYQSKG